MAHDGQGAFAWFSDAGPPSAFRRLPKGGMCLSAFLFVRRGKELLLGTYADDPAWETLSGLDADRRKLHGSGLTIPASHLRYGEDPHDAGRRIAEEILLLPHLRLSEPRVETEFAVHPRFPDRGNHWDVWFFLDAELPQGASVPKPPWFRDLSFVDAGALPRSAWGRSHEDVFERWTRKRAPARA